MNCTHNDVRQNIPGGPDALGGVVTDDVSCVVSSASLIEMKSDSEEVRNDFGSELQLRLPTPILTNPVCGFG